MPCSAHGGLWGLQFSRLDGMDVGVEVGESEGFGTLIKKRKENNQRERENG